MASMSGMIDQLKIDWKKIPTGSTGSSRVEVRPGDAVEVAWIRDDHGLWIETPEGVYGFDVRGRKNDDGDVEYDLVQRNVGAEWVAKRFFRDGEAAAQSAAAGQKKSLRVKAQMPGKIVKVMVSEGQSIEKGQPLIVMEAMKMENEIRAPQDGVLKSLKVKPGQSVESGVELALIES